MNRLQPRMREATLLKPAPPLPELIYSRLREQILDGTLAPGEELGQEYLAKQFGVSRVPLREALNRLQAEGFIVLRPRFGFAVTSLNRDEIVEIFELRMVVEEHALVVATQARTADDVQELAELLRRFEALQPKDKSAPDFEQWCVLNREFHERLVASSRRKRLCDMVMKLRDSVEPYIRIESNLSGHVHQAEAEHRAIFRAFKKGDAETAGRLTREHCGSTLERLLLTLGSAVGSPSRKA
jgi:DNA-binding GntR family transcriptional regulator